MLGRYWLLLHGALLAVKFDLPDAVLSANVNIPNDMDPFENVTAINTKTVCMTRLLMLLMSNVK